MILATAARLLFVVIMLALSAWALASRWCPRPFRWIKRHYLARKHHFCLRHKLLMGRRGSYYVSSRHAATKVKWYCFTCEAESAALESQRRSGILYGKANQKARDLEYLRK